MIADSSEISLKINIPFKNFAYLYRQIHLNDCPVLTQKLYNSMIHAFKYWTEAWETENYVSNINIASLYNLLKADDRPKGDITWKINTYNQYLIFNDLSLLDELLFCLAQHLKKDKIIYDDYPNERKLLFFIAKDIKMFLFKRIRTVLSTQIRNNNFLIPINPISKSYDRILDIAYLNNRPLHMNVLLLVLQNKNYLEIIDILHISRKTYKDIITCLLQNLKPLNK